jgi:hypothetical protein
MMVMIYRMHFSLSDLINANRKLTHHPHSLRVDTPARLRYAFQFAHPAISLRAAT